MALLTPGIICSAVQARSLASITNGGDEPTQKLIADAINTAIDTGLFSTTVDFTSKSSQDIQNNMNLLQQLGYDVSLSDVTLTVNW